jgi:hypothetical protein
MRVEPLSIQKRHRPQWAGAYRMQDRETFCPSRRLPHDQPQVIDEAMTRLVEEK